MNKKQEPRKNREHPKTVFKHLQSPSSRPIFKKQALKEVARKLETETAFKSSKLEKNILKFLKVAEYDPLAKQSPSYTPTKNKQLDEVLSTERGIAQREELKAVFVSEQPVEMKVKVQVKKQKSSLLTQKEDFGLPDFEKRMNEISALES